MNVVRFAPALLLAVLACGGPQDDAKTTTPGGGGSGSGSAKATVLGDYTFEIPKTDIKGVVFEPEALGRPGMPLVESTGPTSRPA